jgi:hypothetical protein
MVPSFDLHGQIQQKFMVLKVGLFIHFEISSNASGESL